jgi:adenylylsulfate kinase
MQRHLKILIMGISGAGKTALAQTLAPMLGAVHFNADEVRKNDYHDSGFSLEDAIQQARRMGRYCESVTAGGRFAIADFICPSPEARQSFGPAFIVWVDRVRVGRCDDENRLFVPPHDCDVRVLPDGSPKLWATHICKRLKQYGNERFEPSKPAILRR